MVGLGVRVLLMCALGMLPVASGSGRAPYFQPAQSWLSTNPGAGHTCGVAVDGLTYCWGANRFGQLGIGSAGEARSTPQPVAGAMKFAHLSAGANHTCGLTEGGDVHCWGSNLLGQLGNGSLTNSATPVKVRANLKFVAVSAGFTHTCGITTEGGVHCWGDGRQGQLGIGSSGGSITSPAATPIPGLTFLNVAAGGAFTCGRTRELKLFCWGSNNNAQLGAPTTDMCPSGNKQEACSRTPIAVAANRTFFFLNVGHDKACAVTNERNETLCWGAFRQAPGTPPASVPGAASFEMLAVGMGYACGLAAGEIRCWGNNSSGQLGNGTRTTSAEPVLVSSELKFGSVRAGQRHACAITTGRQMFCWGSNLDGQLGNGSTTDSPTPVAVK
jgi:alpha-tubulin suppressor-like RCC1 family protein